MKKNLLFLLLISGGIFSPPLTAIDKDPQPFTNPAEEARYQALIEELRCVVCQNQSLADSNAELAQDLRSEVRSMVDDGKSDKEITGFLVERYGEFVLYRPPLNARNLLLWGGPALLLAVAFVVLINIVRRRSQVTGEAELSAEERAKLQQVLDDKEL